MSLEGAIAAHRFGLGARPGEIAAASADPKGWLKAQIGKEAEQPVALDGGPYLPGGQLVRLEQEQTAQRVQIKNGQPQLKDTSPDAVKNFVAPRLLPVQGVQVQPRSPGDVSRDALNSLGAAAWRQPPQGAAALGGAQQGTKQSPPPPP